ncbi:sigma-54 interaction domain-containing protein [Peribacillus asahii]|uniref:HTH-type transcriptional regulatory protein TyrR n=1 Tax=Peribacillus asahii TaxID=228899 RepID=A0A3T0KRR3_9BACI|nr:sigma 54-interacting transcriptional regulator [Peribacillus asahii]AZV43132.1 Fis family transcriptional regulator [Peribacillus asahii]USK83241.1 sigma 54-interacting transcriptional regulator [Peribacillus asahii]
MNLLIQYPSSVVIQRLLTVLEFVPDGIYIVNPEGITLYVNAAYEKLSGFKRKDLVGRYMGDLINEGYIDQSASLMVLEQKKTLSIMQKLGRKKDVIVTGRPVFNQDGNIEMVVSSVRDITYLNQLKNDLERVETISKLNNHRFTFDFVGEQKSQFLFNSPQMKEIVQKVEQVAPFPTSILITGPSGAGKEEIVNLIHHMSDRHKKPLIKVNCAAIPEALLESELFGYEGGAFTGSKKEGKMGLLELADGGTFLLDEIGEMPLPLQAKLLRVIQDKKVQRIGSNKSKKIDIRIISATNRDLEKKMHAGEFREDLFYRIAVVQIEVPPLRERLGDIDVLIDHFFYNFKEQYRIEKELLPKTKQVLQDYHWPGNIRELKNIMESLIVSIPEVIIKPEHLPRHIFHSAYKLFPKNLKNQIENYEKMIVEEAINRNNSIRKAAKELGVHHTTLLKKLQRWGEGG